MMSLSNRLRHILERYSQTGRHWIAYSGGLDSRVLLQQCAELNQSSSFDFLAIHVHHGLQAKADEWAQSCHRTCESLNIPFRLVHVNARAKLGESPEEAARDARYRALRSVLAPGDGVLTAQHQSDQAETLLLQLIRGSGLSGLAAMPEYAPFEPGFLLRPFLSLTRDEIRGYAEQLGLTWIEDPSNQDLAYDRNFIRHEIFPLLERRWPAIKKTFARTAEHCAEAQARLNALSQDLLASVLHSERNTIELKRLYHCAPTDRRLVLRGWLRTHGLRMVSNHLLNRILQEMLEAAPDKNPIIRWSEGEIRRFRGELYLLPPTHRVDSGTIIPWDGASVLSLPKEYGQLSISRANGFGISLTLWQTGKITIRFRQGGESCRLMNRQGTHDLKKLFQEKGIPPWLRERTPLIYIDDQLAAIAEFWVCEPFVAKPGEDSVRILWEHTLLGRKPQSDGSDQLPIPRIEDNSLISL